MTDVTVNPSTDTDLSILNNFLNQFEYELITVSVQPEVPGSRVPKGLIFDPKNRVRALPLDTFASEAVQQELQACQLAGCAIYFLINEGNGVPSDIENNNLNCGKRANITKLKTLAIDTDNANFNDLIEKLKQLKLAPHYVIESSPNRYHLYFLLNDAQTDHPYNIVYWQSLQKLLDDLIPDLDQSLTDINQVLRLPTFYNLKPGRPSFKVKLRHRNSVDVVKKYDLKELYDRLNAGRYNDYETPSQNGHTSYEYNKFEFPESPHSIEEGNRRTMITRYISHIMENVLPLHAKEEDYFVLIDAFILKYLKPQHQEEFLVGKRRQNIVQYYRDQLAYRLKKQDALNHKEALTKFEHEERVEKKELSRDFYINFPGLLGKLTRELLNYSKNLSPELAFAGSLMITGALKAETFRLQGSWPLINGLIIAPTGAGKSTLKKLVETVLHNAGLNGMYSPLIDFQNSVQSLHTSLYSAGGVGTTIVDESGDYLQIIMNKNAPGYAKALRKYFKESTTGRGHGTRLHPGGSLSYQVPPIEGGMLSLWMMIQPDKFYNSLDISDMSDGFLPRFFIFNGKTVIDFNSEEYKEFEPSLDLKVELDTLSGLVPYKGKEVSQHLEAFEKEVKASNPKIKQDALYFAKREEVYRIRSESRRLNSIQVSVDSEASLLIESYLKMREEEAKDRIKEDINDGSLDIYIRMQEMLNRLLCNASELVNGSGYVSYELAKACIEFHRFQTDRFFKNELKEINETDDSRTINSVLSYVKKTYLAKGEPVTAKEVAHSMPSRIRPRNISHLLNELAQGDFLIKDVRIHKKYKHLKTTVYYLSE